MTKYKSTGLTHLFLFWIHVPLIYARWTVGYLKKISTGCTYKALVDILKHNGTLFLGYIYKVPWVFFSLIGYLYLNISVVELLGYQSLLKWYLTSRDICNYRHTCICMYCIIIIFYWYLCSNEILFLDEHPNSDIFSKEYQNVYN